MAIFEPWRLLDTVIWLGFSILFFIQIISRQKWLSVFRLQTFLGIVRHFGACRQSCRCTVFILSFLANWNSKVSRLTTSWKWRVWFVSTCVGSLWSSVHIVYIDVSFPTKKASFLSESVAPTGGSNRLSCVGPVELGKTIGVPVEGCQLCWAYLAVWLFALFHSWYERVEERIVKNHQRCQLSCGSLILCWQWRNMMSE